jgi:hypothetical protein
MLDSSVCDDRNESLHADKIGVALAVAMQTWCNARDQKALRRILLRTLTELEDG